jgi:hypothetical protein
MEVRTRAMIAAGPGVDVPSGVGYVFQPRPDGSGVMIPDPIDAEIVDGKWAVRMTIRIDQSDADLVPRIETLTVTRKPDGPWVSATMLRDRDLKLGKALELAVSQASIELPPGGGVVTFGVPVTERLARRRRVDSGEIRRAAEIYATAKADPGVKDPLSAVAAELHVSRATAHRRVKAAEKPGVKD